MLGKGRIDLVLYFCFPQCIKNLRSTQAQACTCTHVSYYSSLLFKLFQNFVCTVFSTMSIFSVLLPTILLRLRASILEVHDSSLLQAGGS